MRRPLFYGLCLLAGALLVAAAGLTHPVLRGDGAAQLRLIAATSQWRVIHWSLLFGFPLLLVGLLGLATQHAGTGGEHPARAGAVVSAFAFASWSLNVLFMAGAAPALAHAFAADDIGLTQSHAEFVYDMIHPFGLAAERLTAFALGLSLYLWGWALLNGKTYPRGLAWFAFLAGVGAAVTALVTNEAAPLPLYYAQGVVVAWYVATALLMLFAVRPRLSAP